MQRKVKVDIKKHMMTLRKNILCKIDNATFDQIQVDDETLRQATRKKIYVEENFTLYRVNNNNHDGAPYKLLIIPTALRNSLTTMRSTQQRTLLCGPLNSAHYSKMSGRRNEFQ